MNKSVLFSVALGGLVAFNSCGLGKKQNAQETTQTEDSIITVINENVRFCESTYPYEGGLLIANFGTEQLNPLNDEGKGYILYHRGEKTSVLISADGNLSAPKGMFEKDGYLFICDVNKVVVYNLNALSEAPQVIRFSKDDLFINDLVAKDNTLYASVTNSGRIYKIDITDLTKLGKVKPEKWCDITGPNGLVIDGNSMYVASYPADEKTTEDNVVYYIADLKQPKPEKFITESGQYDGLVLSSDKKTMYVTNWVPAGVYAIDMETKSVKPLELPTPVIGAADMTLIDGTLYIPDLPNSQVVILSLLE